MPYLLDICSECNNVLLIKRYNIQNAKYKNTKKYQTNFLMYALIVSTYKSVVKPIMDMC